MRYESELMNHADRELRLVGYSPESEDMMDYQIWYQTMEMVSAFSQVGHSGGSAPYHIHILGQLLNFEALTPITNNPDEWINVSDFLSPPATWQNCRDSRMFSFDGGKTYYNLDECRHGWKARLFGRTRKMHTAQEVG